MAYAALRSSLHDLHIKQPASKETQKITVEMLVELGFRSWQDLVGADETIIADRNLSAEVTALFLCIVEAADTKHAANRETDGRCLKVQRRNSMPSGSSESAGNVLAVIQREAKDGPSSLTIPGVGTTLTPAAGSRAIADAIRGGMCAKELVAHARVQTILASAPSVIPTAKSALKCWGLFADDVLAARGKHLPPTVAGLLAFSLIFRNAGTFSNYLAGLKLSCQLVGIDAGAIFCRPTYQKSKDSGG